MNNTKNSSNTGKWKTSIRKALCTMEKGVTELTKLSCFLNPFFILLAICRESMNIKPKCNNMITTWHFISHCPTLATERHPSSSKASILHTSVLQHHCLHKDHVLKIRTVPTAWLGLPSWQSDRGQALLFLPNFCWSIGMGVARSAYWLGRPTAGWLSRAVQTLRQSRQMACCFGHRS